MGKIQGYIYIHIYYCCNSFAELLYHKMSWWMDRFVGVTAVVLLHCDCCTAVVQGCGWVHRFVPVVGLLSCVHTGSWVVLFLFLPLYRPRAGIVQRTTSGY